MTANSHFFKMYNVDLDLTSKRPYEVCSSKIIKGDPKLLSICGEINMIFLYLIFIIVVTCVQIKRRYSTSILFPGLLLIMKTSVNLDDDVNIQGGVTNIVTCYHDSRKILYCELRKFEYIIQYNTKV